MATKKIPNANSVPETEMGTFEFNNGDYQAMNNVEKEWKFRNKESLLRFALAVLVRAKNRLILVQDENGAWQPVRPGVDLLVSTENTDITSDKITPNEQ